MLSEIPAPDGSQEVSGHTHESSLLIGQQLLVSECRMGPQINKGWDPSCTQLLSGDNPSIVTCIHHILGSIAVQYVGDLPDWE